MALLKIAAVGLAVVAGSTPCMAQVGLNGPFNEDSPRSRQIQTGTGIGISKIKPPSAAASSVVIGTTFGQPFWTTVGSTVGSGPVSAVGSTFGSSTGAPATAPP